MARRSSFTGGGRMKSDGGQAAAITITRWDWLGTTLVATVATAREGPLPSFANHNYHTLDNWLRRSIRYSIDAAAGMRMRDVWDEGWWWWGEDRSCGWKWAGFVCESKKMRLLVPMKIISNLSYAKSWFSVRKIDFFKDLLREKRHVYFHKSQIRHA